MEEYIRIGIITKPQGIKGEAKILCLSDDINRFHGLKEVYLELDGGRKPHGLRVNRTDGDMVYAFIDGYYTREAIEGLRDVYICVHREDAIELGASSWFIHELIGLRVYCGDKLLGVLNEVIQTGAVDVYSVLDADGKSTLFPALKRVIEHVDISAGIMRLKPDALSEVAVHED